MNTLDKPLRILAVVNVPWDPRLGAARVWIELAEEWRKAGHVVEKFCLTDAFPGPAPSSAFAALRLLWFPSLAAKFIRRNAERFDVIDALIGTLPFSKRSLSFSGLLVARSVGLYHLYEKFEQRAAERWPSQSKGRLAGRAFYRFFNARSRTMSRVSLDHCDVVNVPNADEVLCLRDEIGLTKPVFAQPYGLAPRRSDALLERAGSSLSRWQNKKIVFVGMWSPRKGAKEWGEIIRQIRSRHSDARFVFLGTMIQNDAVWKDLAMEEADYIEIVPQFAPDDLPRLLSDCTIGAFPSHIEGFGMAILEQLAARIPTVAYDVPGPRDILREMPDALVPAGDVAAFSAAISKMLSSESDYEEAARRAVEIGRRFSWPDIARHTAAEYSKQLNHVRA
jgi:glycosyltransferase involved in cell wall biosynthesis